MTKDFLFSLNGENRGRFYQWITEFKGEPRVAWYPSAGSDFRDLMFLNKQYSSNNPASQPDPPFPDLFLHTDYHPWSGRPFIDNPLLYQDDRTTIKVKSIEELPFLDLPVDSRIVTFERKEITGKVFFLEVEVVSDLLGKFSAPIVYAFIENAAFCANVMLPNKAKTSHIIHIRHGAGFGGGYASGVWLLNVLKKLSCECFITDGHLERQSGDERIYELYEDLSGSEEMSQLVPTRTIRGEQWSNHGDVSWNLVK